MFPVQAAPEDGGSVPALWTAPGADRALALTNECVGVNPALLPAWAVPEPVADAVVDLAGEDETVWTVPAASSAVEEPAGWPAPGPTARYCEMPCWSHTLWHVPAVLCTSDRFCPAFSPAVLPALTGRVPPASLAKLPFLDATGGPAPQLVLVPEAGSPTPTEQSRLPAAAALDIYAMLPVRMSGIGVFCGLWDRVCRRACAGVCGAAGAVVVCVVVRRCGAVALPCGCLP